VSKLKVDQIRTKLRSLFEAHLDLSDIGQNDAERDSKIFSRCLAALAIYTGTGCSAKDAADAVWDGSDDNGIDSAYYDATTSTVVLAQAKFIQKGSGEPDAAEVGTFVKGVHDLVEQDLTMFHSRLTGKAESLFKRIETPGTSLRLIVISTGASSLAKHATAHLTGLMKELNGADPDPIASFETLGLQEVYSALAADSSSSGITLEGTLLDWSVITTPYLAYFGTIDGGTLKGWWSANGRRLVSSNIRHALGATDVNSEVRKTALTDPSHFWYFNNGITLICREIIKAPAKASSRSAGSFGFKDASIVNGAQTVSTLGSIEDDDKLSDVRVPIRAIILGDAPDGFGSQVTRSNNLQNRIEERDFVTQDPNQQRLKSEMLMENIDYQYIRGAETSSSPDSCELIELTTALACASGDRLAVDVKTGISRFYRDLSKAPYRAIFNDALSGAAAFNTVLVQREVDRWIEEKKRNLSKKSGVPWGALVHGNRILSASVFRRVKPDLDRPIAEFRDKLLTLPIGTEAQAAFDRMTDRIVNEYPGRFLAVLFKNPSAGKDVFDHAISP
jgi:hypothetical protein